MKHRELLLGLDLGTTYFKACVFNRGSGRTVAQASHRLPVRLLENGGREQEVRSIHHAANRLIRTLQEDLREHWALIGGAGVASQGGSTILVTREGLPLTSMLLWNDARAQQQTETLLDSLPLSYWKKLTLRAVPPHGLPLILWLQQHRPELFNVRSHDLMHVGAGDYLFFLLTGEWRQEAGSAVQVGPYDARKQRLAARPLEVLGLGLDFVPPLREGHSTLPLSHSGAHLLGLPAGLPVAGPYIDQEAGYRAAAAAAKEPLQISLGTAWVGNFEINEDQAGDAPFQLVLPASSPEKRLIVLPLLTGNVTWDWALQRFAGNGARGLAKGLAMLEQRPFPHEGLHLLPWNSQPNPLQTQHRGGGVFVGLGTETDAADLLSAAAAGLCYELARVFRPLRESGYIQHVVLSGGASKSSHFRRLLASLMSPLPVLCQQETDSAGARGALYPFAMSAPRETLEPVDPPEAEFQREARERAAEYEVILDRLFGHIEAGRSYELKRASRKPLKRK